MLISRWQAPLLPTRQQMALMLEAEGLEPEEEVFPPAQKSRIIVTHLMKCGLLFLDSCLWILLAIVCSCGQATAF